MKKVIVNVEHSGKNFAAYIEKLPGCITTGRTVEELEKNMREAITGHLEVMQEYKDKIPAVFLNKYDLVFKYETAAFMAQYDGIFTKAGLQKVTGVSQKLLSNYATSHKKPSAAQNKRITEGIHKLGKELLSIEL